MLPRRALVVGLARSGQAAALALVERGVEVVAVDRNPDVDTGRLAAAGVEVRVGTDEGATGDVNVVIKSPGVPAEAPPVARARERGIPVWSEVELGWRLLAPRPFIGVTGTKGKTTTAELLGAMFRAAGRPAEVAGNVGRPLTSVDAADDAWIVCELSSFQLEDVESLRPRVAVLLNLEPDHLDRHGSLEAYREAKLRIFENQGPDDWAVLPHGFQRVPGQARRVAFDASDALPAEPRIPGAHNRENAAAATAAARAAGLSEDAIAEALRSFAGVPHRLELVAELGGVRYVNDSKATNAAAAKRGIAAYPGAPLHLILGGSRKGEDFSDLASSLPDTVRTIHLIGESAADLAPALDAAGRAYMHDETLEHALAAAHAAAEPGDVVLLSPACASFDQFANFEARGDAFRRLVAEAPAVSKPRIREAPAPKPRVHRKAGATEFQLLVLVSLALVAFGLVMVYSATSAPAALGGSDPTTSLKRQGIYALLGLVALVVAARSDYRRLRALAPGLLVVAAVLCAFVAVAAPAVNGARRWLAVGSLTFQPSELAKVAVAIWISAHLARNKPPRTLKELAKPIGAVAGLFAILIVLEPDLGTTIALVLMVFGILVVAGVPLPTLGGAATLCGAGGMLMLYTHPYQLARFTSFLHPLSDSQGGGYQTSQALLSLGSGGWFGRGLGQGIEKIQYLPEANTDMIFAVIGEELGLIGVTLVVLAFAAFAYAGFRVALNAKDPFGKRLAAGLTTLVCGQAVVNLAAVLGIAPLTGIPLPFISYGGTNLLLTLASVGVLLNIAVHGGAERKRSAVPDRGRRDSRARDSGARDRRSAAGARR